MPFNAAQYLAANLDLLRAGVTVQSAESHYNAYGIREGRSTSFDAMAYEAANPDLISAFGTNFDAALNHYISNGFREGRSTSFNAQSYIAANADLISAFGTDTSAALSHYITNGFRENRSTSFNAAAYEAANPDLISAFGSNTTAALNHYITNGFREGRSTSFNTSAYLSANSDLILAGLSVDAALMHFISFGFRESRPVLVQTRRQTGASTFGISSGNVALAEGNSGTTSFSFTIARSGDTSTAASVQYAVTGTGASPATASDFGGALPGGVVAFAPGETSRTISIGVSGDATVEPDETFAVVLSSPINATLGSNSSATATITNDDAAAQPVVPPVVLPTDLTTSVISISVQDVSSPEGNSGTTPFMFTVSRTGSTSSSASVHYELVDQSILNGAFNHGSQTQYHFADASDFGGTLPSGTVTFGVGESSRTLTINVSADTNIEYNEIFAVHLTNPINATGGTGIAFGTISNDDTVRTAIPVAPTRIMSRSEFDSTIDEYSRAHNMSVPFRSSLASSWPSYDFYLSVCQEAQGVNSYNLFNSNVAGNTMRHFGGTGNSYDQDRDNNYFNYLYWRERSAQLGYFCIDYGNPQYGQPDAAAYEIINATYNTRSPAVTVWTSIADALNRTYTNALSGHGAPAPLSGNQDYSLYQTGSSGSVVGSGSAGGSAPYSLSGNQERNLYNAGTLVSALG